MRWWWPVQLSINHTSSKCWIPVLISRQCVFLFVLPFSAFFYANRVDKDMKYGKREGQWNAANGLSSNKSNIKSTLRVNCSFAVRLLNITLKWLKMYDNKYLKITILINFYWNRAFTWHDEYFTSICTFFFVKKTKLCCTLFSVMLRRQRNTHTHIII